MTTNKDDKILNQANSKTVQEQFNFINGQKVYNFGKKWAVVLSGNFVVQTFHHSFYLIFDIVISNYNTSTRKVFIVAAQLCLPAIAAPNCAMQLQPLQKQVNKYFH